MRYSDVVRMQLGEDIPTQVTSGVPLGPVAPDADQWAQMTKDKAIRDLAAQAMRAELFRKYAPYAIGGVVLLVVGVVMARRRPGAMGCYSRRRRRRR